LKPKPYKKKVHGSEKYKQVLAGYAGDDIIFSDEKLFLLQMTSKKQNDRVYSVLLQNIPQE
jgi:hypothetical protein